MVGVFPHPRPRARARFRRADGTLPRNHGSGPSSAPVPSQSTGPPGFLSWPLWIGGAGLPNRSGRRGGAGPSWEKNRTNERTPPRRVSPCPAMPCHAMRSCYCRPCLLGDGDGWMDGSWIHGWACCCCCCDLRSVRLSKHAVPLRRFYCPPLVSSALAISTAACGRTGNIESSIDSRLGLPV